MTQIFLAPRRYVQGDGAVHEAGIHAARLGAKALLTGGKRALAACAQAIKSSLKEKNIDCCQELFNGECSDSEINRLVALAKKDGADFIIASGGGKVIDTGKVAANLLKVPVMVVPTIVATDAPCSAVAVVYTDEGVFQRYVVLPHNPDCVLADTRIIVNAPVETFVSGMGDALATFWEADTCARSCKPNVLTGGTTPTRSAISLARLCYDTLLEYGLQAKLAVENHCVTPAVEAIVEANTLLSGLGFESGGLAGAHSVHNGFTVLKSTHHKLHGQKVAFGTLTQLVMEGRSSDDIYEVLDFCLSVGLPVCLEDLGIDNPTPEAIRKVAEATTAPGETIHATWFEVTADKVESAIWTASAMAVDYRKKRFNK
ncbi:MAG: glycerol dehydrogenase [Nitrospirota bacterium]